jgi:hypothetical protein
VAQAGRSIAPEALTPREALVALSYWHILHKDDAT